MALIVLKVTLGQYQRNGQLSILRDSVFLNSNSTYINAKSRQVGQEGEVRLYVVPDRVQQMFTSFAEAAGSESQTQGTLSNLTVPYNNHSFQHKVYLQCMFSAKFKKQSEEKYTDKKTLGTEQ